MSDYGVGLAFGGLFARQGNHDRAKEELVTLQSFKAEKEKDELMDQQAQMQKAAYDKQVSDFSDKLLGPDRDRINAKAKMLQARVRDEIRTYGGDMSKFMANGGHMILNDYKNSLVTSEESTVYLENKTNMDRLVAIQMSGKGHLINQNDLFTMKEYNKNKNGKISYTGMLNEIEMPDASLYDYNSEIPTEDILDKNHVAIYGNYVITHPENPEPSKQDLLAFTKLHYGGKGANWQRQVAIEKEKNDHALGMEKLRVDALEAYYKSLNAGKKTKTVKDVNGNDVEVYDDGYVEPGEKNYTHLITGETFKAVNSRGLKQTDYDGFINGSDLGQNDIANSNLEDIPASELVAADLALSEEKLFGEGTDIRQDGKKGSFSHKLSSWVNNKYALAGAKRIKGLEPHKDVVVQSIFNLTDKNFDKSQMALLDFMPTDDMFLVNGTQIKNGEDPIDKESYKGKWTVRNIALGAVANVNGKKELVVNRVDDEGNLHKNNNDEIEAKGYKKGVINGNHLIIQLEDESGQNFYKAVEYTSELAQKLNVSLGTKNQLKETDVDYNVQHKNEQFKVGQNKQSEKALEDSWSYLDKVGYQVFGNASSEAVMIGGSYNQDSMNLVKSYYVAMALADGKKPSELPTEIPMLASDLDSQLVSAIAEYKSEGLDLIPLLKNGERASAIIDRIIAFDTKMKRNHLPFLESWKEHLLYLEKFRTSTK